MGALTPEEKAFKARMHEQGQFIAVRKREDGIWMGVSRFLFTWGLSYGLDETGRQGRYCYHSIADAIFACLQWDGRGDPPGPWIVEKGKGPERRGPGANNE
jgi:hypothetical protein